MTQQKHLLEKIWNEIAFIDWRSLTLFRIAFGFILFFDFYEKMNGITEFYSDWGVLPRTLLLEKTEWWSWSLHMASGSHWFLYFLFFIGFILSACLIVGYQTRLSVFLLWIFIISIHSRNPVILHSGDNLIRVMLFWMLFLPLETCLSFDSIYARGQGNYNFQTHNARGIATLASFAILLQLLSMYFNTALLKNHPIWNKDYTALYYALNLEQFTTYIGQQLKNFPRLLKFLTFNAYYLELLGPLALLLPFMQKWMRCWLPFVFMFFHACLIIIISIGLFPWTAIVCWILFIPTAIWDRIPMASSSTLSFAELIFDFLLRFLPQPFVWKRSPLKSFFATITVLFSLTSILLWNASGIPSLKIRVPSIMQKYTLITRLDQHWSMFSPFPYTIDGWFVVDGKLKNGKTYDAWNHQNEPVWRKPAHVSDSYRSTNWRKYMTNVWMEENTHNMRLAFGKYLCRERNLFSGLSEDSPERLDKYDLFFMREKTPPPGEDVIVEKVLVWTHDCFSTTPVAPLPSHN